MEQFRSLPNTRHGPCMKKKRWREAMLNTFGLNHESPDLSVAFVERARVRLFHGGFFCRYLPQYYVRSLPLFT